MLGTGSYAKMPAADVLVMPPPLVAEVQTAFSIEDKLFLRTATPEQRLAWMASQLDK